MRDSGLELAIKAAGGISALARAIGVAQPSVSNWSRVPAERVLAVEAVTAVSRKDLRPDLYPTDDDAGVGPDDIDVARGKAWLLLANLLRAPPADVVLMELASLPLAETGQGALDVALSELGVAARKSEAASLAREHFHLFVGLGRAELLPYASYYRTGFLYERPLVNVREDLAVLGVARSNEGNEPEDSMAFLCEVMAGIALRRFEAGAEFERRFFVRHIDSWADKFFRDLEGADSAEFYRAVGAFGRVFIGLEREGFAIEASGDTFGAQRRHIMVEVNDDQQAN